MDRFLRQGAVLIDSYHRLRIEQQAAQARLRNVRNLLSEKELKDLEEIVYYPYDDIIDNMENEIGYLCNNRIPVYSSFMVKVSGLNIYDSLQLLVLLKDINKFDTLSSFWKYCGFAPVMYCRKCGKRYFRTIEESKQWFNSHVTDRKRFSNHMPYCICKDSDVITAYEKRIPGIMPGYNEKIKKLLVQIGDKIIGTEGFYRNLFFEYQDLEYKKNNTLKDLHITNRARRKVIKVFLYHLYNSWRETEGLPPATPYMELPEYQEN